MNLATNKMLRVRLIKYRALQLFVEMSKVSSNARRDMQDFQRVAALGIRNLAGSFDLRALAGRMGVLEAVARRCCGARTPTLRLGWPAAKAAAELSLHEENGRKLVLAGALQAADRHGQERRRVLRDGGCRRVEPRDGRR